jgi:uncharacterized membrane protein
MMSGSGWVVAFACTTLILLTVAAVAVLSTHYLHWSRTSRMSQPIVANPPDVRLVLDRRLAHGEIDVEEYRALRAALAE